MKLTVKQEKFCQEYIKSGNKTEAYRLAYSTKNMKPSTVNRKAFELFTDGKVTARIQQLEEEIAERNKVTIDELIKSLAEMVRFDIGDFYDDNGQFLPVKQMPKRARMMIESLDVQEFFGDGKVVGHVKKVRTVKKLDAIEKLMRHLGGYEVDNRQKESVVKIINLGKGVNPEDETTG